MTIVKPLKELEQMDCVPIDYGEVFDKTRPYPNQREVVRALELDFPPEKQAENLYDLETTSEIFRKLFREDEIDLDHISEVKQSWESNPKHRHTLSSPKFMQLDPIKSKR
jgi:hypothetical protein